MEKLGTRAFIDWHYNGPPKEETDVYDALRYEAQKRHYVMNMMKDEATSYKAKVDKSQVPDEVDVDEETQNNSYLLL